MSASNPGEEIPPSTYIIQLTDTINKIFKQDSYTNKQVKKVLNKIIKIA